MFNRIDAHRFSDLLLPLSRREARGVYFARVCGWGDEARAGVWAFHEAARARGVVLDGALGNPGGDQMAYLTEAIGGDFSADAAFLEQRLGRWMPRLSSEGRRELAEAMSGLFDELRAQGKNDSALRNLYFKLMCWLYYRFERLMPLLGGDEPPRVLLCAPAITAHELAMLRLLNGLGADVLLLEPEGDGAYLRQDPKGEFSQLLAAGEPFPAGFTLKGFQKEMTARPASKPEPQPKPVPEDPLARFPAPPQRPCTNAWMKAVDVEQLLTPVAKRGGDPALFYNAYLRVRGARDRDEYVPRLRQLYLKLKASGRRVCVADGLTMPTPEEVAAIRRGNYRDVGDMLADLSSNLPGSASARLQKLMRRAFGETMAEASEPSLRRRLNAAVYLLCWIRRYQGALFEGYRDGDVPCFILMGGCKDDAEALFPKYLSRLPVDVLILAPDLNRPCRLVDERLAEVAGEESLTLERFPRDAGALRMDTAASHAREELDGLLYDGSGLYREGQFSRAEALTLRTTPDELFILWDQPLKYRSGFATAGGVATMPVLYAKLSGVEGRPEDYWHKLARLAERGDGLFWRLPCSGEGANPYRSLALRAVSNGRLDVAALRRDPRYPFALLREPLQSHMLEKLAWMLERRAVRGTFENGAEYTVAATVLNLDREVLRLLQSFDFTGKNPKLICACDGEGVGLEDAIRVAYLNLVGFDVLLVVPTGYQTVERYLREGWPVEHRMGPFAYDLEIPDLKHLPPQKGRSWLDGLFGRK